MRYASCWFIYVVTYRMLSFVYRMLRKRRAIPKTPTARPQAATKARADKQKERDARALEARVARST